MPHGRKSNKKELKRNKQYMFNFFKRKPSGEVGDPQSQKHEKPYAVAFVDYEHWYISYDRMYRERPDIRAWRNALSEKFDMGDIIFFGDFSNQSLRADIPRIREITSYIIETQNGSSHIEKDFTDFIMLDQIYQKAVTDDNVDTFIIFSGDGHFSSVTSFIINRVGKEVGVYAVKGALSSQLRNSATFAVEVMPEKASESKIAQPSRREKPQETSRRKKPEQKQEPKPEPKQESKPEVKQEAKPQKQEKNTSRSEKKPSEPKKAKAEPKVEAKKPEPKIEPKVESKTEAESEPNAEKKSRRRRSRSKGESKPDAKVEVKPEAKEEQKPAQKPQKIKVDPLRLSVTEPTEVEPDSGISDEPKAQNVTDGAKLILKNLDFLERQNAIKTDDSKKPSLPTFWGTVEVVARLNRADKKLIVDAMHYLLDKNYIYQTEVFIDEKNVKVLSVDWEKSYGLYQRT